MLNSSKSCFSAIRQRPAVLPVAILHFNHLHYYAPFARFIRFSSYLWQHEDTEETDHRRKPALCDGMVGDHPGAGPQLADDGRTARRLQERAFRLAADRPLLHYFHHTQLRAGAPLHAAPQILEVSGRQPAAHPRGLHAGLSFRRTPPADGLRHPDQPTLLHPPRDVLERDAGALHERRQFGHQAHVPVDPRRAADGGAQTTEPTGRNGLSEISDQPPFLHEHAQQHPRADRHRPRKRPERHHRTIEDDALRALRFGPRAHLA